MGWSLRGPSEPLHATDDAEAKKLRLSGPRRMSEKVNTTTNVADSAIDDAPAVPAESANSD